MSESRKKRQLLMALIQGSKNGSTNTVKLILDKDIPIDYCDEHGSTALMYASINGHTDIVRMLLDKGAQVDTTNRPSTDIMTEIGITCGNTSIVRLLKDIDEETDTELTESDTIIRKAGFICTALMSACDTGHTNVVKLLLDRNAQVDIINVDGMTALMFASSKGHLEIVNMLIDKGAQVNFQ